MGEDGELLSETTSLCPTCLERVPGRYVARDGAVHLDRSCPEHGAASSKVWGSLDHWEWADGFGPDTAPEGDLTVDHDHACLAVIEVTEDCNLSCSYCFASSGPGGRHRPFDEVVGLLEVVRDGGGPRPVQFSGGEPTVRDDLTELVETAAGMGFEHVEVNTNGIRLAREEGYAERLVEAGVTAIYLQFDGLDPETYEAIREVDLAGVKRRAIDACRRADLPVILVPTVVPGVNDHEMGDIVRFALSNVDAVRSVNFQPVAHFGRYAGDDGRFPLDEAADRLAGQVDELDPRDLLPVPCCSSYCQMGTVVVPDGEGDPVPVTRFFDPGMAGGLLKLVDEADWMEFLAGTATARERANAIAGCCGLDLSGGACCGPDAGDGAACCGPGEPGIVDELFEEALPVTLTGFMDADAADAGRLENCCISVPTTDGDLVPFCGYNMTTEDGRYALRERHGWGGRTAVDADPPEGLAVHESEERIHASPDSTPSASSGED